MSKLIENGHGNLGVSKERYHIEAEEKSEPRSGRRETSPQTIDAFYFSGRRWRRVKTVFVNDNDGVEGGQLECFYFTSQ